MPPGDEPTVVDRQWLIRLTNAHDAELSHLYRMLRYDEGSQPLSYMHPELLATLDERVRQVVINWPRLVVDTLEERIDLDGFRLGGQPEADTELGHIWHENLFEREGTFIKLK